MKDILNLAESRENQEIQSGEVVNYINNEKLYEFLKEAVPYFKEHRRWGRYGDMLGMVVMEIMKRIKNKYSFKKYNGYYAEHMQEKALINVFSYIEKYNFEKLNPFNYLSTIIINAYRTAIRELKEKPQEITYDGEIIGEMMDKTVCHSFDEACIADIDKTKKKEYQINVIKNNPDMFKAVENIIKEFDNDGCM